MNLARRYCCFRTLTKAKIMYFSGDPEPPVSDHPKYQDLVVAYESRATWGLFRDEVHTNLLSGGELIACNFRVT